MRYDSVIINNSLRACTCREMRPASANILYTSTPHLLQCNQYPWITKTTTLSLCPPSEQGNVRSVQRSPGYLLNCTAIAMMSEVLLAWMLPLNAILRAMALISHRMPAMGSQHRRFPNFRLLEVLRELTQRWMGTFRPTSSTISFTKFPYVQPAGNCTCYPANSSVMCSFVPKGKNEFDRQGDNANDRRYIRKVTTRWVSVEIQRRSIDVTMMRTLTHYRDSDTAQDSTKAESEYVLQVITQRSGLLTGYCFPSANPPGTDSGGSGDKKPRKVLK